jgi:Alpha-lytic protease prodomain
MKKYPHAVAKHTAMSALISAAVAIVATCSVNVMAAQRPSLPLSPAVKSAMQRDLGVESEQVEQYLDAEQAAIRQQVEAKKSLGESFGGAWLEQGDNGEFKLVVATTQQDQMAKALALGADVKLVERSLDQLQATMSLLNRVSQEKRSSNRGSQGQDPTLHSWRIDLRTNSVVITTDIDATDKALEFVAASGVDTKAVRFETANARPQPTFDIRGGDRYWTPAFGCSMGFSVTRGADTGFATAGHCGAVGTAVRGDNNVAIGDFAGSTFPGADSAWVQNTNPGSWAIQPWVNNYAGGNLTVIGNVETPVGGVTCRSGATTGYRCGTIIAQNVTVNYAAGLTFGLVQSTACVGFGDSGGSFVSPGGEAQGVTSGGGIPNGSNDNCGLAVPVTFHQPIQPILDAYGLVLQTEQTCGRLNPGYGLANGGTVTSCDGRFVLAMQGDGHLVLYQAGVGAIWWNGVFGSGHNLQMQTDGHLVVYNGSGQPVWYTGTNGNNGAYMVVQNDGNVVIYNHFGQALWATNTCCR